MTSNAKVLVQGSVLAIPGHAGVLVGQLGSGAEVASVAAGDKRGEAAVWGADGNRVNSARLSAPVSAAAISPCGRWQAFAATNGTAVLLGRSGGTPRTMSAPRSAALAFVGESSALYVIDRVTGQVELHDSVGKVTARFSVPAPVISVVALPRGKGLAVVTARGIVARFGRRGDLVWGGDFKRATSAIACDPSGEELWISLLAHGAEVLAAASGTRVRVVDVGKSVEAIAVATRAAVVGCSDGTLALVDRAGGLLAQGALPGRIIEVALLEGTGTDAAESARTFARLTDGTIRVSGVAPSSVVPQDAEPSADPRVASTAAVMSGAAVRHRSATLWTGDRRPSPTLLSLAASGATAIAPASNRETLLVAATGEVLARCQHLRPALAVKASDNYGLVLSGSELHRLTSRGPEQTAHFAVETVRASINHDGRFAARVDELGGLHLLSTETGLDVAESRLPPGRAVAALMATSVAGACEVRGGDVVIFGAGWSRSLPIPPAPQGGTPRLLAATLEGAVVADEHGATCFSWRATKRWSCTTVGAPVSALRLATGAILVVGRRSSVVVLRNGQALPPRALPEGQVVAAVGATAENLVTASAVSRMVIVDGASALDPRHVFDRTVLAAALAECGALAVLLDGSLVFVPTRGVAAASPLAAAAGTGL